VHSGAHTDAREFVCVIKRLVVQAATLGNRREERSGRALQTGRVYHEESRARSSDGGDLSRAPAAAPPFSHPERSESASGVEGPRFLSGRPGERENHKVEIDLQARRPAPSLGRFAIGAVWRSERAPRDHSTPIRLDSLSARALRQPEEGCDETLERRAPR
jgi:hypothetical protein